MKNIEHDRNRLLEELKRIAVMHGGECLSTRYLDTKTKLRWRCVKGHEWFALPWNVRRGHWCEICGNERQGRAKAHTIELMRQVADSKGGQCLSPNYRNNTTSLRWRCGHGHEWNAAPGSIVGSKGRKGSWCPVCAGKLPKDVALAELNKLASMRDGSLLSKRYENAKTRMRWECAKGHVWVATADSVKRGSWCPVCGGSYPLSLEQMQKAAQGFGGMCLSADYVNSKTPLSWQCVEGHEWEAVPSSIKSGRWCPTCAVRKRIETRRNKSKL